MSCREPTSPDWSAAIDLHTGVYTTHRIMRREEIVTLVAHDGDGDWQFLGDSGAERKDAAFVCLHHLVDIEPSISGLLDLPMGWTAVRGNAASEWVREELEPSVPE